MAHELEAIYLQLLKFYSIRFPSNPKAMLERDLSSRCIEGKTRDQALVEMYTELPQAIQKYRNDMIIDIRGRVSAILKNLAKEFSKVEVVADYATEEQRIEITSMIERIQSYEEKMRVKLEGLYAVLISRSKMDESEYSVEILGELHLLGDGQMKFDIILVALVYNSSGNAIAAKELEIKRKGLFGFTPFKLTFNRLSDKPDRIKIYPEVNSKYLMHTCAWGDNKKISEIQDGIYSINVEGRIVEKSNAKEVETKYGMTNLAVANLEDESGNIQLNLWGSQIDLVSKGDIIKVINAYVSTYEEKLNLNVPSFKGKIVIIPLNATYKEWGYSS